MVVFSFHNMSPNIWFQQIDNLFVLVSLEDHWFSLDVYGKLILNLLEGSVMNISFDKTVGLSTFIVSSRCLCCHCYLYWGLRDRDRMVVELSTTLQSVHITTTVASSNPVHGEMYSIQHYVIKFVSDLRLVGGFLRGLRFPPPIKLTTTI